GQGPGGFRRPEWRFVDFHSASRHGEPFARLIAQKRYVPNVRHRLCTSNLKVRVGEAFMRSLGYEDWDSVMGIRADEPRRVARMLAPGHDNSAGLPYLPLARAGVNKVDVLRWWAGQPFNLALDPAGDLGNCDLCFLKGRRKLVSAIRADHTRVVWWLNQEHVSGQRFLTGYASYADLLREADFLDRQFELDGMETAGPDHESTVSHVDCRCGD
ncbi:Nin-like protein, partial [Paraburkholderia sp. USG1]|uniref:Nin-like protein n=1 Tax=Paraburkholderia sp. USG1 TaxID=2952268 RepID=UPI00285D4E4D